MFSHLDSQKMIWAKIQMPEAHNSTQYNPTSFSHHSNKPNPSSLLATLSQGAVFKRESRSLCHSAKTLPTLNQKAYFFDQISSHPQPSPSKAEIYQTSNSSVIIITDIDSTVASDHSGDSSSSGQEDGGADGSGDGSGGTEQPLPIRKKIKHEHDHKCSSEFIQPRTCQNSPQKTINSCQLDHSKLSFEIDSQCSTNDMHCEDSCDFSPLMSFNLSAKHESHRVEEFRLDDESYCQDSTTCSDEDHAYLKEAFDIANQFEGSCTSKHCTSEQTLLNLTCKLGHTFMLNLSALREKWCPRCHKNLQTLKEYAKSQNGKVLNTYYSDRINYECEKNHQWSVSHKNAQRRWCSQCSKEERAAAKKSLLEENKRREALYAEMQKKLFEQAQKSNIQSVPKKQSTVSSNEAKQNLVDYFEKVEANVDRLARKQTLEYVSSPKFDGNCSKEQVLQVYKVIHMPEAILKNYMYNLPLDALKADFRRLVKLIHPDKNKHPQAGQAFQKIYKVYESAVNKLSPANSL